MSSSPVFSGPLYEQVHELLRGRIISGEWRGGRPIPGEVHLSRELGVSIGTVRKAMDKLASERIVVRERGRGTFIAEAPQHAAEPSGRLRDERGRPIGLHIGIVDVESRPATNDEMRDLRCRRRAQGSPRIIAIERHWHRDERLICRETLTVDEARLPRVADNLPASAETCFDYYASAFGVAVQRTSCTLTALTGEQPGSEPPSEGRAFSAVVLRRIAYDAGDTPVELCVQRLFLRSEIYHLDGPAAARG